MPHRISEGLRTKETDRIWGPAVCTCILPVLAKVHGENEENSGEQIGSSCFFKVFQAQHLPDFSRRPSGFDPDSLELKRPTFDRFHQTFSFIFLVF